jgi:hypothetical protein
MRTVTETMSVGIWMRVMAAVAVRVVVEEQ